MIWILYLQLVFTLFPVAALTITVLGLCVRDALDDYFSNASRPGTRKFRRSSAARPWRSTPRSTTPEFASEFEPWRRN